MFVRYSNNFYHLSRYSNKIDRIYLQQYILRDDKGLIFKNEKSHSLWGYISLSGDSYSTGNKKDLMNEGSSSRLYSFNIYLKSDVVYYNRSYKKLFLIIADGLPIVSVVFTIFKLITKVFKISSGNKKLTELLFENLQEKPNKIKGERFNVLKLKQKKVSSEKKIPKKNEINNSQLNKNFTNNNNNMTLTNNNNISLTNNNLYDASSVKINTQNEQSKSLFKNPKRRKSSLKNGSINTRSKFFQNLNQLNNQNKILTSTFCNNIENVGVNNNNININIQNNNIGEINTNMKYNDINSNYILTKSKIRKKLSAEDKHLMNNSVVKNRTHYEKKKLFPYKYYLCSIFIKNIDLTNKPFFFTKKFIVVYNFICQLFDISSYLILLKEFQIMKNTIIIGKYKHIFENRQKINVNDHSFNTDMKECIDSQKFSILGRVKY
jgi:hypothetical protein